MSRWKWRRPWDSGRARGEGDQGGIVRRSLHVDESGRLAVDRVVKPGVAVGAVAERREIGDMLQIGNLLTGLLHLFCKTDFAERDLDLRFLRDIGQFARPQQRHRQHADAARLQHGEPTGGDHRCVS